MFTNLSHLRSLRLYHSILHNVFPTKCVDNNTEKAIGKFLS